MIEAEYERSVRCCLRLVGRERLLDGVPVLQRSIGLRNPYVDAISELQVRLLARLRALPATIPDRPGSCAWSSSRSTGSPGGLQNTG